MVVYVVTGASRGLGYEFLCQLSGADNVVFGLVRNAPPTEAKVKADNLQNVHILQADIIDLPSLQAARSEIQKITPVVDVLINNAAYLSEKTAFSSLSDFENNPDLLEEELKLNFDTNVIGVIKTINTFLPMVEQSKIKKVISISSGLADDNLTNGFEGFEAAPYSISKAGLNTAVAKYNARHKKDGILFLSISPGVVDTGNSGQPPPDSDMPQKFMKAYPDWRGPITPEESIKAMMKVIDRAEADNEFAGAFVSHYGNKQWL